MYSKQIKKEVIHQIQIGMRPSVVSQKYGVNIETIRKWVRSPDKYLNGERAKFSGYDLEEKIQIIRWIESGDVTVLQAAAQKNIHSSSIYRWIEDKDHLLELYSSQEQRTKSLGNTISSGKEAPILSTPDNRDEKQHERALKEENEFLKAKVAYLETLMELNGTPASEFKKKLNTRPSTKSSGAESDL